jgi:dCMP deaminase
MKIIEFKKYYNLSTASRIPFDFIFMQVASLFSTRAECQKASVGCCIVKDNRIISCGYNGDFPGGEGCTWDETCPQDSNGNCLRAVHAEQNAISFCAKNGISTNEAVLYTTLSPCISCAKIIVQSGIKKVVYLNEYTSLDGIDYLNRSKVIVEKFKQ